MSDPIADMLTAVRNGSKALRPEISMPYSKLKERIGHILKKEGYVVDCFVEGGVKKTLKLKLKFKGRIGIVAGLKRVSTPGLRRYVKATEVPRVLAGMGVAILSTPKGVMTGLEAKKNNVGGELLCFVW